MLKRFFKKITSVRAKLFCGFAVMAALIFALGSYSYVSISQAGDVVKNTFDRPLMAINYARSASQIFGQLENKVQGQKARSFQGQQVDISEYKQLFENFKEDLEIAKLRSIAPRADTFFAEVESNFTDWSISVSNSKYYMQNDLAIDTDKLSLQIVEDLDIIVELQKSQSFRNRETAINRIQAIKKLSLVAVIAAGAVTILFSSWVAFTIIHPLKEAADAAREISIGNFDVKIPKGREDETGALLTAMSDMQNNIQQRIEIEQNSRELAQQRLSESLENSKDAIILTDVADTIIVANDQVKHLFSEFAGSTFVGCQASGFFMMNGRPKIKGCGTISEKFEFELPDGRWARVNASDTEEGGRLFIWTDITASKNHARRLSKAKNEAEAANNSKTLFLAAMSHELRTPLNAIIGLSNVISIKSKIISETHEFSKLADHISKSGSHLLRIVKDVLSIADGESISDISQEMTEIDIVEILSFCVSTIHQEAKSRSIQIILDKTQAPLTIWGNETRLQQLFLKLLSNAVIYNIERGIVKISLNIRKNKLVVVDIIDTGIGIPETALEEIVKPFVQVETGYTRKYDGAGLGLSVAKQLVSQHKGRMSIHSKFGKGTCVRVILPLLTQIKSAPSIMFA